MTTSFAELVLSGKTWLWFGVAVLAVLSALLFWSYSAASQKSVRWICAGCKTLGIAALLFCLLEPLWSGQRARPGANVFAVLADNSESLQIKDRGASRSRAAMLTDILNPQQTSWQAALEENFEVRRYLFDGRLQSVRDFGELSFDGSASAINLALLNLGERYHGRPLAGILLLTDGNGTDLAGATNWTGLPPIYPVAIGTLDPIRDLAVQQAHVTQTAFEDAPVSVQAQVTASRFSGQPVVAQLLDAAGKIVADQTLRPRTDEETLAFRFQFRPASSGLCFYRLRVASKDEVGTTGPAQSDEATLTNNSRTIVVDRGGGPYRILYVAGRPNWEFKFLNRAVQEDDQIQMVGLIRVAKREPKFNFLGRAGETSNPLYRGFGNQTAEDVERYDQPVLVRLNTRDELELRTGFPRTAEDLYRYAAIIIDDVEAEFFSAEQALLVQKFVGERGAGLLMLGGMESFQQGNYKRTPIGDILPVYLNATELTQMPGPVRLGLTREGWLQEWARLRDSESAEKKRLQEMSAFHVLNAVREVKPGASVIATVTNETGQAWPALVIQRFGRGRTAALTIGDLWRWGAHDPASHQDLDKFWRQSMRWLVNDTPKQVELTVQPQPPGAQTGVMLQVRARDEQFRPVDNASATVIVEPVDPQTLKPIATNAIRLQAEPAETEPGLYQVGFIPRSSGGYKASVTVTNSEGVELGRSEAGWSTDPEADEFRSLSPNVSFLKSLAQKTGGELVSANQLRDFVRSLPTKRAPVMDAWTFPLWHTPAMLGFALACLFGEWALRRWKGLP
jgi:uncharacterized membrane protein